MTSPVVVEDLYGAGQEFPHVYGPIDVAAVIEVRTVVTPTTGLSTRVGGSVDVGRLAAAARVGGLELVELVELVLVGGRRGAAAAAAVGRLLLGPLLGLEGGLLGDEAFEAGEAGGVEAPVVDRGPHRAARLLVVLAVAEAALVHEVEDVGERPLDALAGQPEAERPDARRVDQPALAGQRQQLGGDGRVAARAGRPRGPRSSPGRRSRAGR